MLVRISTNHHRKQYGFAGLVWFVPVLAVLAVVGPGIALHDQRLKRGRLASVLSSTKFACGG